MLRREEAVTRIAEYCEYNRVNFEFLSNYNGLGRPIIAVCATGKSGGSKRARIGGAAGGTEVEEEGVEGGGGSKEGEAEDEGDEGKGGEVGDGGEGKSRKFGTRWLAHEEEVNNGLRCSFHVAIRRRTIGKRSGRPSKLKGRSLVGSRGNAVLQRNMTIDATRVPLSRYAFWDGEHAKYPGKYSICL